MGDTSLLQTRLFLTFAGGDLIRARPVAAQLRCAGNLSVDYTVPPAPFTAPPSAVIRASLVVRLRRCAATVCLFGADTLADEWVRWTLAASRELGLPLLGAPLEADGRSSVADLLEGCGAEIVPLRADVIAHRAAQAPPQAERQRLKAESLALTLRMMRHPLR